MWRSGVLFTLLASFFLLTHVNNNSTAAGHSQPISRALVEPQALLDAALPLRAEPRRALNPSTPAAAAVEDVSHVKLSAERPFNAAPPSLLPPPLPLLPPPPPPFLSPPPPPLMSPPPRHDSPPPSAAEPPAKALPQVDARTLPLLDAELALAHSSPPVGNLGRTVIVAFSDWWLSEPPKDAVQASERQRLLARSFSRTLAALPRPCLLGLHFADPGRGAEALPVAALGQLGSVPGGCAAFHAGTQAASRVAARVGRWWHIADLVSWGYDVLSLDLDVALLRDPLPYLGALLGTAPAADVLTSSDATNGRYSAPPPGLNMSLPRLPDEVPPAWVYSLLRRDEYGAPPAKPPTRWDQSFPSRPVTRDDRYVAKPELKRDDSFGIAYMLQALKSGEYDLALDAPALCHSANFNVGMQLWRATPRAATLLTAVQEAMTAALKALPPNAPVRDQPAFNAAVRAGSPLCSTPPALSPFDSAAACDGDVMLATVAGGACLGVLNLAQWANGLVYSVVRSHEQHWVVPFALHATFTRDKVSRLREEGALRDDALHYGSPGDGGELFLAYTALPPLEMFHSPLLSDPPEGYYTWQKQYNIVQWQARQLRAALGLALMLNRTLVLPRAACVCQCSYSASNVNCAVEGQRVRLPHVCPTEHWLRLDAMRAAGLPFREPGFLDNPAVPPEVLKATLGVAHDASAAPNASPVHLTGEEAEARNLPPTVMGALLLPDGRRSAEQLAAALAPRVTPIVRVLHWHNPGGAWRGFSDAGAQAAFTAKARKLLGAWCCLKNHPDGTAAPDGMAWKMPYDYDAVRPLQSRAFACSSHSRRHPCFYRRCPRGCSQTQTWAPAWTRWLVRNEVHSLMMLTWASF